MNPSYELRNLVEDTLPGLEAIPLTNWSSKPNPEKWSKKEVLGHLIDSASNNLRRFVVTQYQEKDKIFYKQDEWVSAQNYQNASAKDLIQLWYLLNLQIVLTVAAIPADNLSLECDTGKTGEELHTLEFLIKDYSEHLQHHLEQIL